MSGCDVQLLNYTAATTTFTLSLYSWSFFVPPRALSLSLSHSLSVPLLFSLPCIYYRCLSPQATLKESEVLNARLNERVNNAVGHLETIRQQGASEVATLKNALLVSSLSLSLSLSLPRMHLD